MVNDVRHELYPEFLQRTCPYFFTFDRIRRCYKWANIAFIQVSHTTQHIRFLEPKGTTESGVQKGVNPLQQAVPLPQSPWNIFEVKTISTNAACSDYRRSLLSRTQTPQRFEDRKDWNDPDPLGNQAATQFDIVNSGRDGAGGALSCGQGSVWRVQVRKLLMVAALLLIVYFLNGGIHFALRAEVHSRCTPPDDDVVCRWARETSKTSGDNTKCRCPVHAPLLSGFHSPRRLHFCCFPAGT